MYFSRLVQEIKWRSIGTNTIAVSGVRCVSVSYPVNVRKMTFRCLGRSAVESRFDMGIKTSNHIHKVCGVGVTNLPNLT